MPFIHIPFVHICYLQVVLVILHQGLPNVVILQKAYLRKDLLIYIFEHTLTGDILYHFEDSK